MKRKLGLRKGLSALVLGAMVAMVPAQAFAYDSQSTWKSRIDAMITSMDNATYYYGYTDTPRSELLGWNGAYTVDALIRMYEVTKDASYIAKASEYIDNMYDNLGDLNSDGYLGWGTDYYAGTYTEYVVHYGTVLSGWAKFILLVKADSTLAATTNPQGISYGSQIASLETSVNNDLLARWNKDWSVLYNTYLDEYNANKSLPHNMYLSLANALYLMYQVNPTANKHYLLWADQMVGKWKGYVVANGTGYKWNYHDQMIPADDNSVALEDWSHASVDIQAALMNYNRGGSWTGPEVTKLGNTLYSVMYDGNAADPGLYHNVGGTGAADGELTGSELDLDRWVSGIWTRAEKNRSVNWGGVSARVLMDATRIYQQHPSNAAPGTVTLSSPANGATGIDTTTAFLWQPSQNASDYTLQISTSSTFSSFTVNRPLVLDPSASVQSLAPSTTYYWRVIARNDAGTTSTSATRSFTTKAAPTFTLTFNHYDTRSAGSPAGILYKQVLVDDVVVWERDVTADAANTWLSETVNITSEVAGQSSADVKFRVISKGSISNYSVNAYFDNISITNADMVNGGFEKNELWRYLESGTGFTGSYDSSVVYSGGKSYKLALPASTAATNGHYGAIDNRWALYQ